MISPELTDKEDLFIDVLAGRFRVGEVVWTFDVRHKKTAQKLADKGLVTMMNGTIEDTFRAALTDKAKGTYLSETYITPAEEKIRELENDIKVLMKYRGASGGGCNGMCCAVIG